MKQKQFTVIVFLLTVSLISWKTIDNTWLTEKHKGYDLYYTAADKQNTKAYNKLVENGMKNVKSFFKAPYQKKFDVFVHPNRHSLDSTWQKDWKTPEFKSECWMVASGIATKLDMISPKTWDKASCEHVYSDTEKTQQLITHELVHVFHGQRNASPDFSDATGMDWFVEGLATYASGQCDATRINEIQKAITANEIPDILNIFWTGKLKYGLSGSVVLYIDHKYGREKLIELLKFNKKTELLASLNISEANLLKEWKSYIMSLK
jgi:hypothetical protein